MLPKDRYENRLILVHSSGKHVEQVVTAYLLVDGGQKESCYLQTIFHFSSRFFLMTCYICLCTESVYSGLSEQSPG